MSRRHATRLLALGTVTLLGVVGACGDDPDPAPAAEPAATSESVPSPDGLSRPGSIFEVEVGGEVTIVLESNATTGYSWELETPPLADVVRLVEDVYVEPDTDLVGAAGRQELTFEAVGEGTAEISLWYVRTFEDPLEPVDRATFEIVVS